MPPPHPDSTLPGPTLPPCLYSLKTREWGPQLVLAHCGYRVDRFQETAHAVTGIPASPALAPAAAKRRTEYLAGRLCARAALQGALGMDVVPGTGADRAPTWPDGAVGAITHAHGEAAALVGSRHRWAGLGLDREPWLAPARAERLRTQLLTDDESVALDALTSEQRARRITRTFSVKESLFKALYPLVGRRFYFRDAALDGKHIVLLTSLSAGWRAGARLAFHCEDDDRGVLSWITVEAG